MSESHREVEGTIQRLRCDACGSVFPHFLFSGEEDSDTAGLCSAAVCGQKEVLVIVEADPSEWNDFASGVVASLEDRLKKQCAFGDLKVIRLLRVEREPAAAGLSFSDFRKAYKPPVPIYSCVCCDTGESRISEEVTVKDFVNSGGRILLTGRLALHSQ